MTYIEVKFTCCPNNEIVNSILSAEIAGIGFESFVESETGTTSYIVKEQFDEQALNNTLSNLPIEAEIAYVYEVIEDKDWNEEWEKNYFKPLIIDNRCIIQSTFHNEPAVYEYNIIIDPKMAFGTGHHQTTELIIRQLLEMNLHGKSVLDMGCGTAILAILASMRGANPVLGIDIDQWAYDNALENLQLNHIDNAEIQIGGADLLGNRAFDVILANINRNILLNDIPQYAAVLNAGGELYMSGFYVEDIPAIRQAAELCGLSFSHYTEKENWAAVKMVK
jgi:ribosomal protein L11 methyltransferase